MNQVTQNTIDISRCVCTIRSQVPTWTRIQRCLHGITLIKKIAVAKVMKVEIPEDYKELLSDKEVITFSKDLELMAYF